MKLYLLRHAEAVDNAPSDKARQLTEKGLKQAEKVGRFCSGQGIAWDAVLTSPLVRARQTADGVLSQMVDPPSVEVVAWLASGMDPETALSELTAYRQFVSILLVGHEPDFSSLASYLIGAKGNAIRVRKAAMLLLELETVRGGGGSLQWLVPVKLL